MTTQISEEMAALVVQFEAALADAASIAAGRTPDQFNWRDQPGRWSIGECLDHLTLVNRMYSERFEEAMERGRRDKILGHPPFSYPWLPRYFLRSMEPPARFKVRAPKPFEPAAVRLEPEATLGAYRAANVRLRELVAETGGLDLSRIRVSSPALAWWKWPLGVMLPVCAAHDRRHLYQARQVMMLPGFPGR